MSFDPSQKLKGVQTLTPEEQINADTMKALKESKKTNIRQPCTGGSSEGTGVTPGVPDEFTIVPATSSEGTEEDDDETIEWVDTDKDEEKKDDDDDKSIDLELTDDEETDDEFMHSKEQVQDDDEEMDDELVHGDEQIDAGKNEEVKDDAKKAKLPPTSSSLTFSILASIPETPLVAPETTLIPPLSVSTIPPVLLQLRVAKLEKNVSELKKTDHSAEALATLKSQPAPKPSKIQTSTIDLKQEYEKSALEIHKIKKEQAEKQNMLKYTIKSTDKETLKENPANHTLYHALMEALIEDENAMDKGVFDTVKNHKRQHDDDEDPSARLNQGKKTKRRRTKELDSSMKPSTTKETSKGKAPSKSSKTGKSVTTHELIEEPIAEVVMDDLETTANEDVVNDANRHQDNVAPKTDKSSRDTWFKQPPRPPTPDPEWNKRQVVTDQPEQPWFNKMVSAAKDPLTFDELIEIHMTGLGPQHYLIDMQEVILFYKGLDVPTRQILDSKGAIPSMKAVDAKKAIQDMADHSQKWHNRTSTRTRSIDTSDGLVVIQAQLNNLGREIKKVNERVYAAQVGCESCGGPHYAKNCPLKEEGKTFEEAHYTQFGVPFPQGGRYRAAALRFYQRDNGNPSYQERRQTMEKSLSKFMAESAKRHDENSNLIKEIRASIDATIRNQGASIKALEIQIGQMSKVLQERRFGSLPSSTETNPRDHVKSILTTVEADTPSIRRIDPIRYALLVYYCS
ncbi:hypothetical protein Tco_0588998 [Tanacetum coccineum]